ncbi:MAG: hypothetical protein JWO38_1650 [Gemmataceae bacterium]|nr:hypothetical protein [Gemmataceae bacterium]
MRVIEQLVQHFWARGTISREEALHLVRHGFVREADLPGLVEGESGSGNEDTEIYDEREDRETRVRTEEEEVARRAEELEEALAGRQGGGKKGGRKKRPTGHNLAPAVGALDDHFAARDPYPALAEWADRLSPPGRSGSPRPWKDAAAVIGQADPAQLEPALVGLLAARPRALGELWHWFNLEPLFEWAGDPANAGPVADGLAKLMRVANPNAVGRAGQLMKAPAVRGLSTLLEARRNFLNLLLILYDDHFPRLGQWLVPPAGDAAGCWPALPWAFVLVYNARTGTANTPQPGYEVKPQDLAFNLLKLAVATAYPIAPAAVGELLITRLRLQGEPTPERTDWERNRVFGRSLFCPFNWRL